MRYLQLFWLRIKLSIAEMMHDRVDFAIETITQLVIIGINLVFFAAIFGHVTTLNGWTYAQAILVLAIFQLTDDVSTSTLRSNVRQLPRLVQFGQLDTLLVQPVDPQLNLLRRFDFHKIGGFIGGLLVFAYALSLHAVSPLMAIGLTLLFVAIGYALHWAIIFGLCTLGIWIPRIENIVHLAYTILDLALLPTSAYGRIPGQLFTFVLPLAVIATIPAELILGTANMTTVVIAVAIVGILFLLSRAFFFWALKSYSSASG